ncbi:MAG: hypothetical protein QM762_02405 [Chryseolinea sp.]
MRAKEEERKSHDGPGPVNIETPPPPQVIDPSRPPGQGRHETYQKDEDEGADSTSSKSRRSKSDRSTNQNSNGV